MRMLSPIIATIDLGSNSFHLLIIKLDSKGRRKILFRRKQKVQMRAGLNTEGSLSLACQTNALTCLREFAEDIKRCNVHHVSAVGTYTFRKLSQDDGFIEEAQKHLGHPIQIISGDEEARLIYLGAISQKQISSRHLIIDIGGGSTELIIGENNQMLASTSLEMGSVSFEQRYFPDEQLTEQHFDDAIDGAKVHIAPIKNQFKNLDWEICLGGSGTIKAISSVLREAGWDNGLITLAGLRFLYNQLLDSITVSNISIAGLRADRINVLAGGLSILMALFIELDINELRLSRGAIREGILQELIAKLTK